MTEPRVRGGVPEAKTQLSTLLRLVAAGQEIEILRNGEPVARLVAAGPRAVRQLARTPCLVVVADDAGALARRGARTARRPGEHAAAVNRQQLGDRHRVPPRKASAPAASGRVRAGPDTSVGRDVPADRAHACPAGRRPADHHDDSFDRLIVAQAQELRIPVVTADAQLSAYSVDIVPV